MSDHEAEPENDVEELFRLLAEVRGQIDVFLQKSPDRSERILESQDTLDRLLGLGKELCKLKCHAIYIGEKGACGPGEEPGTLDCRKKAKRHLNTCKNGC